MDGAASARSRFLLCPVACPVASKQKAGSLRGMNRLVFWFDPASTYSYLSAMRIEAMAQAAAVDVEWRPFLLGPIFKAQGMNNSPFALFPLKGEYMWRDMQRQAQELGIGLKLPDAGAMGAFPRNSVLAARACIVALREDWGRDFVTSLYLAEFAEGLDIADRVVIADVVSALGQDAKTALDRAQSEEIKLALRENTQAAQAARIFGAPSFTVGDELFWGNDRLEQALRHAGKAAA